MTVRHSETAHFLMGTLGLATMESQGQALEGCGDKIGEPGNDDDGGTCREVWPVRYDEPRSSKDSA